MSSVFDSKQLGQLEAALLDDDSITDCAVIARVAENGDDALVAYVVTSEGFSPERCLQRLGAKLPDGALPSAFVSLTNLPLTVDGELDEEALGRLPVIDEVLTERWERSLKAHPDVDQVSVVAEANVRAPRPLHLDELLPERAAPTASGEVTVEASETPGSEDRDAGPLALADGGPLVIPADDPQTLTEALVRTATEHGDRGVTYVASDGSECSESYAGLLDRAQRILTGLQRRGLGPGDHALLQLDALEDHYAAFWACILGGIVPVPVAVPPSYGERNGVVEKLFGAWQLLGQPPVIASSELVEPLRGLGRLFPVDSLTVLAVAELLDNPPTGDIHDSRPGDLAFLQLSSGSTGVPKCIQELHSAVLAHANAVRQADGYSSDDVTLNWMPVDHVGALIMWHLRDTYLGCRQVQVKTDLILAEPLKWLDLLEAHRVSATWSPNFAYKLVADELAKAPDRRWDLSRMRWLLNGGEQVTLAVAADFLKRIAPFGVAEHAMQPAYGGAETCTRITANNRFSVRAGARRFAKSSLDGRLAETERSDVSTVAFIDVGPPIPGVQLRIVDADGHLLPEGVIGRLQIKGPVVTSGYLDNEAANQEAFSQDGWLSLGDLGFLLDGRLSLTGREKETIVVRGANFYCHEIEEVVNAVEGVEPTFAGACAVADPATGTEGFAVFFVPSADAGERLSEVVRAIRARVAASLGATPTHVVPIAAEDFPKTTSGKIQRAQLRQALEAGKFQDTLRSVDLELENANTVPDWFYRRTWRLRAVGPARRQPPDDGATLVFDRSAQGSALAERLDRDHRALIEVEEGGSFERIDQVRFRLNPGDPDDYRRLLATLAEDGIGVGEVVHLWTYEGAEAGLDLPTLRAAQRRGAYSLLFLIQALSEHAFEDRPVRVLVASRHAQPVVSGEEVACQHGPLLGLLRTAVEEAVWIDCRHVDLEGEDPTADAQAVGHERRSASADAEVAYRDGRRWVPRLERADLAGIDSGPLPFERGGVYLLTGGLGGIGRKVAEYLLESYEANVLLVGRGPLRDERASIYGALKELPGEVSYRSCDIADPGRLREVVSEAETRWGRPLDGVLHLAGVFEERLLTEETRESFAASLRPKVEATWVLHELASERAGCAFVSFSSLNGVLGGFGVGAYAAANSFLDSFTHYRRSLGLPSNCFAWSLWEGVGMASRLSAREAAALVRRGLVPITATPGMTSLLAALHRDEPHLLIGLDPTRPNIRRHVEHPAEETLTLRAYFTGRAAAASLDGLEVPDRFGTPSSCELVPVAELPGSAGGSTDPSHLTQAGSADTDASRPAGATFSAPRTPVEHELAAIWAEVLELNRVGIEDSFFELGGYSLLAVRVMRRLNQHFGVELPLRALFDAPTVAGLALLVTQARAEADADIDALLAEVEQAEIEPLPQGSSGRPPVNDRAARIASMSPEQRRLLEARLAERARSRLDDGIPRLPRDQNGNGSQTAVFPLSPQQRDLLFIPVFLPPEAITLRLHGKLDVPALEASLRMICARHEALRTTFDTRGPEPVQVVRAPEPVPLARVDLRELAPSAREEEAGRVLAREAQRPFDLSRDLMLRATLVRLGAEDHTLLVVVHHIACDGWSTDLLCRELAALYGSERSGGRAELPELSIQYPDYAVWQLDRLREGALQESEEFWREQLADLPQPPDLPIDRPRPGSNETVERAWCDLVIAEPLVEKLRALSRDHDATLFMTLLAAWVASLHRYSGRNDRIALGTPFANRGPAGVEDLIGFFANYLVLRHDLDGDPSFAELIRRVRDMTLEAMSHGEVTPKLAEEPPSPFVQLAFFMRSASRHPPQLDELEVERIDFEIDRGEYSGFLSLVVDEGDRALTLRLYYQPGLFRAAGAARMLTDLRALLEKVVVDPAQPVSALPPARRPMDETEGEGPTDGPAPSRRVPMRLRHAVWRARRAASRLR